LLLLISNPASLGAGRGLERITPSTAVYHDVVNVGIIQRNGKVLLIDSGEGSILRAAKELGIGPIDWVLYTHHHRDQCSGAPLLKKAGVKIAVPAAEARFFRDATQFWLEADNLIDHRYYFRPDLFVLRSSVAPDRELAPGEIFKWEGIAIRVLPTPGHTDGSVSFLATVDGQTIAFTGDLIYGPGQLWEFYSLQKHFPGMKMDFHGFGGAVTDVEKSLDSVLALKPSVLVPSHGVIMRNPPEAVRLLRKNVDAMMDNFLTLAGWRIYFPDARPEREVPMFPRLPAAKSPPWIHKSIQTSAYLQADDKSIFLLDAGFAPIVDEIDRLAKSGAISGVDAIWVSHYHDDHVESVNAIRRKYGAKLYAQAELRDILEHPRAYLMPCVFPESTHVDHVIQEGEVINWKGFKLTGYYFPGQTIYHDALLIEKNGTRLFVTGDSMTNFAIDDYCIYNRNFAGEGVGYERCLRLLLQVKPDLMWAAHTGPLPVTQQYLQKALGLVEEREKLYAALFPWDSPNFSLDPGWVRAYPYRQDVFRGQPVTIEARIYNRSESPRTASVELRAPSGWNLPKPETITIPAKSEGKIRFTAVSAAHPPLRREVLGLAVRFDQRNLGEIEAAIVDYLE
jgi:glyoxylase-like metal-dependent hydrolase (beta-lactamase superfamily II)